MDAIEALITRKSSARLTEPAPNAEEVKIIMQAAGRAPDHGRLRPWRFLVVEGEARQKLGGIFRDALQKRDPEASDAALEKESQKPLRAPMMIIVIARVTDSPKVPPIEQYLSAGAAAENIMLAIHALGYAGIWRTGAPCFDAHVKAALGARDEDMIVGFLYIGTAERPPILPLEAATECVEIWNG
ncbi:MAG: nitroreductase [Sneathiella sp.]|uniref:nitroreductase family protein n=1 Tax=Sneathiella sp. TaxID=1964365 RepID=UPI000C66F7B4|nr:nitroreductase [Sneathiella sp.]MAL80505.1 nitroreductase [Sneathiella sp.]